MAPMTSARDLRNMSESELRDRERELREELFNLRFQFAAGELANHARIKQAKRELARVLTVLREKKNASKE